MKKPTGRGTEHDELHFSDLLKVGRGTVSDVKVKLGDAKDFTVDSASSIYSAFVSSIKARPVLAVGLAFGMGYFAMRIFRPRHGKNITAA